MTWSPIEILTAPRLTDLYTQVCERAGLPTTTFEPTRDRFVVRCGSEPPALLAKLLQEALPEAAPEIAAYHLTDPFDLRELAPGQIVVREGFDMPAPIPEEAWQSVRGGRVLVFAVERHGERGRLRSVVWVAVSEEPSLPEDPLRAAVAFQILDAGQREAGEATAP
jgi:hypothetical protein